MTPRRWSDVAIVALIATALIAAGVAVVAVVKATSENSPVQLVLETATATPTASPPGPTAVPWLNALNDEPVTSSPYPSNATPVDTPTRPCSGEDLVGGWEISPYGETHPTAIYFSLKNISGDPCRLDGTPQVSFMDADGNDIPVQLSTSDKCGRPCFGGVLAPPESQPLSTPYGQSPLGAASAEVAIGGGLDGMYDGMYVSTAPPCQYVATAIVVRVPESDAPIKIPLSFQLNPCVRYTILPFNVQRPPPPPPDRTPTFQVHIVAPPIVDSGSPDMQYTVILTNQSDKTVSFAPGRCPNYTQTLGNPAQIQPRALNCSHTGQIAPGRSIAFAMDLSLVPLEATTTYNLAWSWVDTYAGSDSVKVKLLAANPSAFH
jgi:Protein of unknown function (DUF4232)